MSDTGGKGSAPIPATSVAEAAAFPGEESGERPSLSVRVEEFAGAAVMAVIALITFVNVVVRYATDLSFAFTEEVSIGLVVVVTLIGASLTITKDRHIRVEYFLSKAPLSWRRWLLFISMVPVALTMLVLVVSGGAIVYDEYKFAVTSPGLAIPQWLYTVWLPVLSLLILLRTLQFMKDILKGRHP